MSFGSKTFALKPDLGEGRVAVAGEAAPEVLESEQTGRLKLIPARLQYSGSRMVAGGGPHLRLHPADKGC